MSAYAGSARSRAAVSKPSSRGITTSSVITSGPLLGDELESLLAVAGDGHLEPLELEVDRDQLTDHLGVVDDEDVSGGGGVHADPPGPATAVVMVMCGPSPVDVRRHVRFPRSPSPRSSGDRAPPSGGGCVGSNPTGGATDIRLIEPFDGVRVPEASAQPPGTSSTGLPLRNILLLTP